MRCLLLLGAMAGLAACPAPSGVKSPGKPVSPAASAVSAAMLELPAIPAKIDITTSAPMDGNAPGKKSPILGILAAEDEREMATLGKESEPAYYLAYQLVDQRQVTLEADGGALTTDQDDTDRNLDVDVRVGSPKLDNTHPLSDDPNGLNSPL